jgi:3',5'-cyclic AMP phosphodiesterase CpdA
MDRILLVHFSDVHFGSSAYNNPLWKPVSALVANGHDNLLVDELMLVWNNRQRLLRSMIGAPGDPLHVVVSGDLTRVGSPRDFAISRDFFYSSWGPPNYTVPKGTAVAGLNLALPPGALPANPGNHDQWAGANWWMAPPAYNPFGFINAFGRAAWQSPMTITQGALAVELYGVDSNSGLVGSMYTPGQGGAIDAKELASLESSLAKAGLPSRQTVRVALCHHGFDHVGTPLQPLDAPSREELLRIASDHEISVVLTGHSHYVFLKTWTTSKPTVAPTAKSVWEIRATTPVAGSRKYNSATAGRFPGNHTVCHGFFVHDIRLASPRATPTWDVHAILLVGRRLAHCGSSAVPL